MLDASQHTEVTSVLVSPVSVLESPVSPLVSAVSGIASSMTILGHTRLESPLTALISGHTGLPSTLTAHTSTLTTSACWPKSGAHPSNGRPLTLKLQACSTSEALAVFGWVCSVILLSATVHYFRLFAQSFIMLRHVASVCMKKSKFALHCLLLLAWRLHVGVQLVGNCAERERQ